MTPSTGADIRTDIFCFGRLFQLVIHYELGNTDLLEYHVRSTYRFLYKRKRLYRIEAAFLDFIRRQLPRVITGKNLRQAFMRLKTELETLSKDPFEKNAFSYFDFLSWVEARISGKTFSEIVREKAIDRSH